MTIKEYMTEIIESYKGDNKGGISINSRDIKDNTVRISSTNKEYIVQTNNKLYCFMKSEEIKEIVKDDFTEDLIYYNIELLNGINIGVTIII